MKDYKENMKAPIYYQSDCNLSLLEGKTIAIIGYGSQGHAHALNLKESGCHVIIGLYKGSKSWAKAEAQGFEVFTAAEAAKQADIIMILINDEKQAAMYKADIERAQGTGSHRSFRVSGRQGRSLPGSCLSGCDRQGKGSRAGLCTGHRRRACRRSRDHLQNRDRDRPLW